MNVLQTRGGSCRDCYKCVRYCPLKAIKVEGDSSHVIPHECIDDGLCSLVCPKGAREIVNQWDTFHTYLQDGEDIVVSLAPTYLGLREDPYHFIGMLSYIGVWRVEENAWVVPPISAAYWGNNQLQPLITSSCPSVVRLIQVHFPKLVPHLAPFVSPMVLHGRYLRKQYPQAKIVYVDACAAKKGEREQFSSDIDVVLTYQEVFQGLRRLGLKFPHIEKREPHIRGNAAGRRFALSGGWKQSVTGHEINHKIWAVSGFHECIQFLQALQDGKVQGDWAELLLCEGGCLGGPGFNHREDSFIRQSRLMSRLITHGGGEHPLEPEEEISRSFVPAPLAKTSIPPDEVLALLQRSGKEDPVDQLNCGACGYNTCKDQAIAVIKGKAEISMCIPHMRTKAESMANVIIRSTPNGIIVVDKAMNIVSMNPAMESMFHAKQSFYLGKPLANLMDPKHFLAVLKHTTTVASTVTYPEHKLTTRQIVFPEENQGVVIGIFVDISQETRRREDLRHLKGETIHRAKEVIEKQMRVAQEIAGLLGETTGETKILLSKLIRLMEQDNESLTEEGGR